MGVAMEDAPLLGQFYKETIVCSVLFLILQQIGIWGLRAFGIRTFMEKETRWWLHQMLNMTHHIVVGITASYAILWDPECSEGFGELSRYTYAGARSLNYGTSKYIPLLVPWTLGYMIFDLLQLIYIRKWKILILLHHTLALILWPTFIKWNVGHMWIMYYMSTEITGPFNVTRIILSEVSLKQSRAFIINGVAFTVLFIIWRLLPIPALGFALYRANPFNNSMLPPSYNWEMKVCVRVAAVFAMAAPLLNLVWGYQIIKGAYRIFSGKEKSK